MSLTINNREFSDEEVVAQYQKRSAEYHEWRLQKAIDFLANKQREKRYHCEIVEDTGAEDEFYLPPELKTFINYAQCKKYKIIRYTPHTTIQNYTLNKEEYEQIHEIEKQKLILSNITDLPTNLDDTYDIIYLSNIIHYIYSDCLTNTISNLSKHLTQDGVIILDSLPNYYDYSLKELKKLIPNDFNFHHLEQIENRTGYKTELCRILTKKSR